MHPDCVASVQAAAEKLGRAPLTRAQLDAIESRILATQRQMARTDPDWQSRPADERVLVAAEQAMVNIKAEADRKVANAQRQILKTAATDSRVVGIMGKEKSSRSHAVVRDIEQTQQYINGIRNESMGNLMNLLDASKSGEGAGFGRRVAMFLFDADNPAMTRDLAREIFQKGDGSSGNKIAQEGAKAYLQVIEGNRQRFNNGGGDVGRLEYGYIPQPHEASAVRNAGREKWVDKIFPLLDRTKYVLEDGSRMGDEQLRSVLDGAWETIATEGLNKMEPGSFRGGGAKANAGSESRQIHFKDADGYLAYMQEFGRGGMYDAVMGHVGRMARDIGLIERYGPNPNAQMELQLDLAARTDGRTPDNLERIFGISPQSYWNHINGTTSTAQSANIASIGMHVRAMQTMGKLGGAVISSITDLGTFFVTTGYNRLNYWDAVKNIGKTAASKDARDFLTAHGVIAESMSNDMSRWAGDHIAQNWSGRLANSTMKLSLMNAWTDTLRRSFSLTQMQGLAKISKTEWGKLNEWDRALLERKGFNEADWQVVQKAELTDFSGKQHLTPEAIRASGDERANEVVSKYLGMIQDEAEFAVLNPDLAAKVAGTAGLQAGTVSGELARSMMQFKSFPLAMVSRHWRRMFDAPKVADGSAPAMGDRVMYGMALAVTTSALGAIATQAKQVVAGKDPIDMTGPHAGKFWVKAVAQGGGLSIVGDLMLNNPNDSLGGFARSFGGTLAGPAISTAAEGLGIALEEGYKASEGKQTHAAARTVRLLRSNLPYVNLWYAKSALDHAGMHALQESLSPGYLSKMKARASKDFGSTYWWSPGTGAPERAPDMAKAVGG